MNTQKQKLFEISGYVQVEVTAYISAKNLTEAKKFFEEQEKTYGRGNGTLWNYKEGNWVSPVEFDKEIVEVENGLVDSGITREDIATTAKVTAQDKFSKLLASKPHIQQKPFKLPKRIK